MQAVLGRWVLLVPLCGALLACGGGDDPPPSVKVATGSAVVPLQGNTDAVMSGQRFTFAQGVPALGLVGSSTVTMTSATSSTTSPTFSITNGGGAAAGSLSYGSCIFVVISSNIPALVEGESITVSPCQYDVLTGGIVANGQSTAVQVLLQLGITPSAPNQAQVSINPETGVVTVNNFITGRSVTLSVVTGGTGG
jgi:hypothetical protein